MLQKWAIPALLLAAALTAGGCKASSSTSTPIAANPTAKADQKALVHKATLTLDYCVPQGTVAQATALATIAQPAVIDALLHHASRARMERCWAAYGIRHGVSTCVLSQLAQAPSDLASRSGRDALGQAVFSSCLVAGQ